MLTLTGPGGTGKTRLAIQAAAELAKHYPDGVFWVGLASLRDPQLVLPTIAQALGAKRALHEHIGGKRLLLLLDSLEHLIAGAPEFTQLLAACPQLNLLCTSREPLHLSGEQEYPVPTLTEADAVSLFAARAFAIKPDFSANGEIAEICRRLDQLPLAIELAAARVKVLSPAAILARLEQRLSLLTGGAHDLPERQRTLRAAIEWSYDLLSAEEQRLFARLAVFAGGCTLEAAEEICDADLDTLQSLVDKSLIRHSGERYWMLETIREFAAERLIESGDAKDWRLRHADFFVRLAEQAEPEFMGAQQLTWLQLLDAEHDNFRTAIDFLRQIGDVTRELKLIGSHWRFWYLRGFLTEGRRRVESALTVGGEQPSVLREKVLYGALVLAHRQGDYERAEAFATERLALAERLGDTKRLASSLLGFGLIADVRGDYDLAVTSTRRGAELARETGDKAILAMALNNLGDFAKLQGEYEQAKLYFEEALAIFRELPDTHGIAAALTNLGSVALEQRQGQPAMALLTEGLECAWGFGDKEVIGWCLEALAAAAAEGSAEKAATLLGAVEVLREDTGAAPQPDERRLHQRTLARLGAELDASSMARAWEEGRSMTLQEAVTYALTHSSVPRT